MRTDRCESLIQEIAQTQRVGAGGERARLKLFIPLTILYPRLGYALSSANTMCRMSRKSLSYGHGLRKHLLANVGQGL